MKRLVCCLDGTWNDDRKASERTNVVKLCRAIPVVDSSGARQISDYVEGIATTQGQRATFLRGAIGLEVHARIAEAFKFLSDNYVDGDEIFIFGFSRGAFEARSLAGFISIFGLAKPGDGFSYKDAWACYRQPERKRDFNAVARLSAACRYPVPIKCLGLWDTVGNIGNPFLPRGLIGRRLAFHDMRLHDTVEVALQALSVDEPRGPFRPTLFTMRKGSALASHQRVEQVWFPGTHCDVGGGWPDAGLSDIALLWMAERVAALTDLAIDLNGLRASCTPNPLGPQHAANTGIYRFLPPFVRPVLQTPPRRPAWRRLLCGLWRDGELPTGEISLNETLHPSVSQRFGAKVVVIRKGAARDIVYRPINLEPLFGQPSPAIPGGAEMLPAGG